VIDKSVEHWLPEVNEPEIPQVTHSKPYIEITEFLKEENLT